MEPITVQAKCYTKKCTNNICKISSICKKNNFT